VSCQSLGVDGCQNIVPLSSCHLSNLPSVSGVKCAGTLVPIADKIVTLGVTIDRYLPLSHHTSNVCTAAYFHIRALLHIRVSLTKDMAIAVAVSVVHSRLDYANSVVHDQTNDKRLQSVQNSVARVVLKNSTGLSSREIVLKLHWLGYLFRPGLSSK